jgi:hypothetical protein
MSELPPTAARAVDIPERQVRAKTGREQMQQNRMRHRKIAVLRGSLHTGGCHIPSPAGMMEGAVVFGQ